MSRKSANQQDPRLPNEPLQTVKGSFKDVRLDFTVQFPPEPIERRSYIVSNHSLELARLHIFLSGADALHLVPSAYLYQTMTNLIAGISDLLKGKTISSDWASDPWEIVVRGEPGNNHAYVSVQSLGNNWIAMHNVCVPLDRFCRELVDLEKRLLKYLDKTYPEETRDPVRGQYFRNMLTILDEQQKLLLKYERR